MDKLTVDEPAQQWAGTFGDAYHERNQVDWEKRVPFWRDIMSKTRADSVLELGCGPGWNLAAINKVAPGTLLGGIEINPYAAAVAEREVGATMLDELMDPRDAEPFDLTFTAGCLIHIPPADIQETMAGLVRASNRWVLSIEYEAEEEEEISYRGQMGMLWKRPYCQMYADMGLTLREIGFLIERDGFDRCKYGLFEK